MSARKTSDVIREELEKIRLAMITSQQTLGIKDTGRSAASIKITGSRALGAVLTATKYLETKFDGYGRPPGGKPSAQDMLKWGKLSPEGNQTRLQAAYAVARHIGQVGTSIHRGAAGIPMDKITKQGADNLAEALADNEVQRALDAIDQIRFTK